MTGTGSLLSPRVIAAIVGIEILGFVGLQLMTGGCSGCRKAADPAPATDAPVAARLVPASVGLSPGDAYLAWTVGDDGAIATSWLEPDGAAFRVAATRPLLVLARDGQLIVARIREDSFPSADCPCEMEQMPADDPQEQKECPPLPDGSSAEWMTLESVPGAGSWEVVPRTSAEDARDSWTGGNFQATVVPVGSAGGLLGVRVTTYSYGCGAAHGGFGSSFFTWDLGAHGKVSFPPPIATAELAGVKARALEQLKARESHAEKVDDLDVTLWMPQFAAGAPMKLRLQVTGPDCGACADGTWSSYASSAFVERPGPLPAEVAADEAIPTPVDGFIAGLAASTRLGGWTRVPAAGAPGMRALFESIQPHPLRPATTGTNQTP